MTQTTYVSSEQNETKQAKLNNVIKSLSDFVSCTTNDCTIQDYGELNYEGEIAIGQVIKGNKRPRKANVPIVSQNNVFLGYLDAAGNLTVRNNKQILNTVSEGCSTMSYVKDVADNVLPEVDCCTNLRRACCICNDATRNSLITRTYWDIWDCRQITCDIYQCIGAIYYNESCIGAGCTTYVWGGDNNLCLYARNTVLCNTWNNPDPIVILDGSTYNLVYNPSNKEFIDKCLKSHYSDRYCSSICSCGNAVSWNGTIYTELKNTVEYTTTSYVRIKEKYV